MGLLPLVRYVIITPIRNEERLVHSILSSVIAQTVLPQRWIFADDGSTDSTIDIIKQYQQIYPFITSIELPNTGALPSGKDRVAYASVPKAFNYALSILEDDEYDFMVKLDADLSFGCRYFEQLFERFEADKELGIAGGHCYELSAQKLVKEWVPDSHVRGATKVYRKECFKEIAPIREVLGWDTLDEVQAQMKGWRTRSFDEPRVIHHRPGGQRAGVLRGRVRNGRSSHAMGYHPAFMIARGVRRMFDPPYLIGGLALIYGFFVSYLRREQQFVDADLGNYLRKQQLRRLLGPLARIISRKGAAH